MKHLNIKSKAELLAEERMKKYEFEEDKDISNNSFTFCVRKNDNDKRVTFLFCSVGFPL